MLAKSVALLLADLGVTKTHSRPHLSNDNPYSESQFKTLKYHPEFPNRFGSLQDARSFLLDFFQWYNTLHHHSQAAFGEFITEEILAPVPHRHVVISLPRRLRPFFRRRKRLTRLARLAYETLKDLLQAAAGTRTATPDAVACLQRAGNLLDWHPHVHLLVSWGLFRRDGSSLPVEGTPELETVARLFRYKVLRMLLDEGAIAEGVIRNLLARPHTGFGTHVSRTILADEKTPGVVARHMTRPPATPERMLGEADKDQIIYRSEAVHPRHRANFRSAELATKPLFDDPPVPHPMLG